MCTIIDHDAIYRCQRTMEGCTADEARNSEDPLSLVWFGRARVCVRVCELKQHEQFDLSLADDFSQGMTLP